MAFTLFDAPEHEPSRFVGFAGNVIDRQSEKRSDTCGTDALAHADCRVLLLGDGRVLLGRDSRGVSAFFSLDGARAFGGKTDEPILLGIMDGVPVVAIECRPDAAMLPDEITSLDYRAVHMQGLIPPDELGALAQGGALLAWHVNHRFCGRCGGTTEMRAGGYKRVCTQCSAEHFPRTDPVAIMLAVTPDACLLGRSRHFPPGMYSTLAGFIEPGETIEAAVRRETLEESGVRVGRVVYHASQPWPFPYSLMIGCFGEALTTALSPDLAELEDCRWFSREELALVLRREHPDGITSPPRGAIANHLIRAWAEG